MLGLQMSGSPAQSAPPLRQSQASRSQALKTRTIFAFRHSIQSCDSSQPMLSASQNTVESNVSQHAGGSSLPQWAPRNGASPAPKCARLTVSVDRRKDFLKMREPRCGFIAAFHQRFGTYDLQNYLRKEKGGARPACKM